jgi:putative glutamine amidotransferase
MNPGLNSRPRVGVPYRTVDEERSGKRGAYDKYLQAIVAAGGEPVELSLLLDPAELSRQAESLDGIVLPGSPADVDPDRYHSEKNVRTAAADPAREKTDTALLEHFFRAGKPVLAICYGTQHLNVFLGGTLVQDIASETGSAIEHSWHHEIPDAEEPHHMMHIEPGTKLAELAKQQDIVVNSSHHQSVLVPGGGLRIVARSPDGVVEALEWIGGPQWIFAAQWHPERMQADGAGDRLSQRLFSELVGATRVAGVRIEERVEDGIRI